MITDRQKQIKEIVETLNKDEVKRKKLFNAIYGGYVPEMCEDWKKDSQKNKEKFVNKYITNEGFYMIMASLKQNKGNLLKTWSELKKYGKDKKKYFD